MKPALPVIAPPPAPPLPSSGLVPIDEAAHALGVEAAEVRFLLACGVLAGEREQVRRDSLARFVAEVTAALAPGEGIEAGVRRVVHELRVAWDRALVERGPAPSPETRLAELLPGVLELGRHPDGTLVIAAHDVEGSPPAHEIPAVAERIARGNVRVLAVEEKLLERWGVSRAGGRVAAATPFLAPAAKVPPPTRYLTFRESLEVLGVEEDELKGLIARGEIRAFRSGLGMRLKRDDVENLKSGRESEPTVVQDEVLERGRLEGGADLRLADEPRDAEVHLRDVENAVADAVSRRLKAPPAQAPFDPFAAPPVVANPMPELGAASLDLLLDDDRRHDQDLRAPLGFTGGRAVRGAPADPLGPASGYGADPFAPAPSGQDEPLGSVAFDRSDVDPFALAPHDVDPLSALEEVRSAVSEDLEIVEAEPEAQPVELGGDDSGESEVHDLFEASEDEGGASHRERRPRKMSDTGAFAAMAELSAAPEPPRPATVYPASTAHAAPPSFRPPGAMAVPAAKSMPLPPPPPPMPPSLSIARPSDASFALRAGAPMAPPRPGTPANMPAFDSRSYQMPVAAAGKGGGLAQAAFGMAGAFAEVARSASAKKERAPSGTMALTRDGAMVAPQAAPAPAKPAAPELAKDKKEDDEPETFERKATVRYYSQMYARRNYPLLVVVSKRSIQKIVQQHVAQVESKKSFKIRRGNPFVTVRPILPGCICVPAEITLNVKPKVAEAKFWVTPQAEGELEEAKVEVLYEGKVVSTIDTPTRVTTQALAKASGALAFFSTSAGPVFEAFGVSVKKVGAGIVADFLARVAEGGFAAHGVTALFAFLALVFYLKRRPKAGPETEGFFDWGVEDEVEGDPLVRAVKAKLVVVGPEGREVVDLVHGTTLVGAGETAHVRVRGSRSLPPVAVELRYDDAKGFVLKAKTGGVTVDGEDVALEAERRIGRDGTVELEGGKVALWVMDVRQDAVLDEKRGPVLEALAQARPTFGGDLRALFAREATHPVRVALLAAMQAGWVDPLVWLRARRGLKLV